MSQQLEFKFDVPIFSWKDLYVDIRGKNPDEYWRLSVQEVDAWGHDRNLKEFVVEYPSCKTHRKLIVDKTYGNHYNREYIRK